MKLKTASKRSRAQRSAANLPRRSFAASQRGGGSRSGDKSFPVVGIGASAGGYEAFVKFLEALPVDSGIALVFVQHLDPAHESRLAELLARATRLPVTEVQQSQRVEANHVYVIPPNKNLIIKGGQLQMSPRRREESPPLPVDCFLRSLAEDQGQNAIGVVLSGNGSDGTLGLEAIKGADGITFAQEPQTAKYLGMPSSAIASGCVDFVLTPEKIARQLATLRQRPYLGLPDDSDAQRIAQASHPLSQIYSVLGAASGVDFAPYKQSTLKRRITRRMVVNQIETMEEYVRFLQSHPAEPRELFDDVLITLTRFFREPKLFQVLAKRVFPALINDRPRGMPIRLWVAGCASGEEVYSIAISLVEFLGARSANYPVQVFGTDISDKAIAKARAGFYRASIAQDVSAARLRRFFTQSEDGYRVGKAIRNLCVFARQNLGVDPPFSNLDLISCQNVLIYFGVELQKRVVPIFHYALKPNGFLVLGPAEGIGGFSELFTQVERRQRVYVKASQLVQPEVTFGARLFVGAAQAGSMASPMPSEPPLPNIEKVADRILLQHYTPSGVIVDSKLQVLEFRGFTAPFLEHAPGAANLRLLKLVRHELAVPLRACIAQALKKHGPVRNEIIWARGRNRKSRLKLQVVPFKVPPAKEPFLIVLFEEGQMLEWPEAKPARPGRKGAGKERRLAEKGEIARLREELMNSRESFRAAIEEQEASNEELKSANEEIQSSNEELQSTNEELETAKEEMLATNEELVTVNEELQNASHEVARVNDDLNNLLASAQIPVVIVDNSLVVRRFTPAAQKFFNLIPTDVGRRLGDLNVNLEVGDLDQMILSVIETLHLKETEVRDHHGHWYSLCIRPYRTKDNRIEGAVLALLDIDELKRGLAQMVEMTWEPCVALDSALRVFRANEAFYELFQVNQQETEGNLIYELGNGQWNIPRLRALLEEVLPQQTSIRNFQVEHDFPKLGPRKMLLNARRMETGDNKRQLVLLAIQNVTATNR